jgi:hypothetical protein
LDKPARADKRKEAHSRKSRKLRKPLEKRVKRLFLEEEKVVVGAGFEPAEA